MKALRAYMVQPPLSAASKLISHWAVAHLLGQSFSFQATTDVLEHLILWRGALCFVGYLAVYPSNNSPNSNPTSTTPSTLASLENENISRIFS
jgi:hypothetical protein